MRSWLSALVLVACGTDQQPGDAPDPACATSELTYENFGAAFMLDWCRGCHSSTVPDGMRQDAPDDINFDDLAHVRAWADPIAAYVDGPVPTMPPAAGPSQAERDMLGEWIRCGAN